jgi:hypothetical protein
MWCGASWGVVSRTRRARGGESKDTRRRAGFGEPGHLQNCSLDRRDSEDDTRDAMVPTWPGSIAGMVAGRILLLSRLSHAVTIACHAAAERHVLALCGCCFRGMCISERCSDCCAFKSDHLLSSASPGQSRTNERRESIRKTVTLSLCRGKETAGCSWQIYVVCKCVAATHERRQQHKKSCQYTLQTTQSLQSFASSMRACARLEA